MPSKNCRPLELTLTGRDLKSRPPDLSFTLPKCQEWAWPWPMDVALSPLALDFPDLCFAVYLIPTEPIAQGCTQMKNILPSCPPFYQVCVLSTDVCSFLTSGFFLLLFSLFHRPQRNRRLSKTGEKKWTRSISLWKGTLRRREMTMAT